MAAFSTGTATGSTSGLVRVYIVSDVTATTVAYDNYPRYSSGPPYDRLDRHIERFEKLALTAYERKLAVARAASARQAEAVRASRLRKQSRPRATPPRARRCCSLAGAWRVRH